MKKTIENKGQLRILQELGKEPSNSFRLSKIIKKDQSSIYKHLINLLNMGYVEKKGKLYYITNKLNLDIEEEIKKIDLEIIKRTNNLELLKKELKKYLTDDTIKTSKENK